MDLPMVVITTADGSKTISVDERLTEIYHSKKGAIQESEYVFIRHGLEAAANTVFERPLRVLEVGFGTGLNALLTWQWAQANHRNVRYLGYEPKPLSLDILRQLDYSSQLGLDAASYYQMHQNGELADDRFIASVVNMEIQDAELPNGGFDCIYFDAFGPDYQPDMWAADVFDKLYHSLADGGILVTYCAKGVVKRTLRAAGFLVETLPGPPGKREMIRAIKPLL